MKKVSINFVLVFSFLAMMFFTACQKESDSLNQEAKSENFTSSSLESLLPQINDKEVFKKYLLQLYNFKEDGMITISELKSVANPKQDIIVVAALKVTEKFSYDDVLWNEKEDSDVSNSQLELRGISLYRWTGGSPKFSMWCVWGSAWPANEYVPSMNRQCNRALNGKTVYVCKGTLTCPPFP